jgi:hypothetical protein
MSDKTGLNSSTLFSKHLIIILVSYAVFALIFGYAYRFAMNPDGIPLLRFAGYIAEGKVQQAVASGWSPLLPWLIAPLLAVGFNGLTAARITIGLCGAGMLLCSWLLSSRFALSRDVGFIVLLILSILISFWTIQFIASDVLVATLTLFYIYLVTDSTILNNKKVSFLCGLIGGFSYLAHHYALPFFMVHFPAMLFLKAYIERDKDIFLMRKVLISWILGICGFIIVAFVWVGAVSAKYGNLTISSKAPIAHAAMGPGDLSSRFPHFYGGLNKPENEYSIHIFEDPSGLKFETWSPFESMESFIYQLNLIKDNIFYILDHFVTLSPFFTRSLMIGVIAIMLIACFLVPLNSGNRYLYSWVITTFAIYCSGFILIIAKSPRRFYALMIVFILLAFHFYEELRSGLRDCIPDGRQKIVTLGIMIIFISAFVMKPSVNLLKSIRNIVSYEQVNPYEEIADQINTVRFSSPYAIIRSSQKPTTDLYIAYYLKKQLLGRPLARDVNGITEELYRAGAKSLLVFDKPELVDILNDDDRYIHLDSVRLENNERYDKMVSINIKDFEIISGWDKEVSVFKLKFKE